MLEADAEHERGASVCVWSGVWSWEQATMSWHLCHSAPIWQIELRVVNSLLSYIFTAYVLMLHHICAIFTHKAFLHSILHLKLLKYSDQCTYDTCNYISSNIAHNYVLLSLDVIGVCKTVEDVSRITTKNSREVSKRTLHLIDTTGKVVAATLWGEEVIITVSFLLFLISFKLFVDLQVKYICKSTHQSLLLI